MVTLGGIVRGITQLAVQTYDDRWARRLRFVSFFGATIVMYQVLTILSGGTRSADVGLIRLGVALWLITYILMWLRMVLVFVWLPMANRRRRARAHAIKMSAGQGGQGGSPPPGAT